MRGLAIIVLLGLVPARPAAAQELYPGSTETYLINFQAFSKSPVAAYCLSAVPGFGAGHFYAEQYVRGVIFAAGELVGLGLVLLSTRVGEEGGTTRQVLGSVGWVMFGGFKVTDMDFAPDSAELHNKRVAKRLKIKALALQLERSGHPPATAYGLALETPF